MTLFSPVLRISLCLVSIALSVFFLAMALDLVPDYYASRIESRKSCCEHLAVHCSLALQKEDLETVKEIVLAAMRRNLEIQSAAFRKSADDKLPRQNLFELGDHSHHWDSRSVTSDSPDFLSVPIFQGAHRWGTLELCFLPLQTPGALGLLNHPVLRFYLFYTVVSTLAFYLFVRLLLRKMNTSQARVVPKRVRATLDTLTEGVVILDKDGQIVMANKAFARAAGASVATMEGQNASALAWSPSAGVEKKLSSLPWERSLTANETQTGVILNLEQEEQSIVLAVNSMPILGEDGSLRGALASFHDLTPLEEKNADQRRLLQRLHRSREKIQRQNVVLNDLATKDPLTACLNRRAFFKACEYHWAAFERSGQPMSCVMIDIDHFKSINDNHGHSAGDTVLKMVSGLVRAQVRKKDLVCRYGGEEFCVLLPGQDLAGAWQITERLRKHIEGLLPLNLPVTASLGISDIGQGAGTMPELVEQADKALYVAKRSGRNRVQRWDQIAPEQEFEDKKTPTVAQEKADVNHDIPYKAVNALLTILDYRHPPTADHCRRVADLCLATANGVLSQADCYVLEMAALLHDMGKLGVPDKILLKPGTLTPEEWKIIKRQEEVGEDMVGVVFSSSQISTIIRFHHLRFGGDPEKKGLPKGDAIPLGARILAIADAFDSMVADQVYRGARTQDEAFLELQRHGGMQFDPKLVEVFIQRISERNRNRSSSRT